MPINSALTGKADDKPFAEEQRRFQMKTFVRPAAQSWVAPWIAAALAAPAALMISYGLARDNLILAAAPVALAAGMVLSAFATTVLWIALGIGLVVSGLAKLYVPAVEEIRWLVVPLAGILLFRVVLHELAAKGNLAGRISYPPILWWALAVLGVALLATLTSLPEPLQVVRGLKGYFQVWAIMIALALLPWPDKLMRARLPQAFLVVALLQVPFAIHQHVALVPLRSGLDIPGMVPQDIISGTFGAQLLGGGANAMLGTFMFIIFGGILALWKKGAMSTRAILILAPVLLTPMLFTEVKVTLIYVLVLFFFLIDKESFAKPGKLVGIVIALVLGLAVLLSAYTRDSEYGANETTADLIERIYRENVYSDHLNSGSFSRAGALRYWASHHIPADIFAGVVGHGLYESRHDSGAVDLWNIANPSLGIKITAVSAILWDMGLLGLAAVFGLLLSAYATAGRLERHYGYDPYLAGLFRGAKAGIVIIFISLWVKSFFSYQIAYQTMLVVLLGWLAYWDRRRLTEPTRLVTRYSAKSSVTPRTAVRGGGHR